MPFRLEEVNPSVDWTELIELQWTSFENPVQPFFRFWNSIIKEGPNAREETLKQAMALDLYMYRRDPTSYWQKVVDIDTGKIIAGALWQIYLTNPFELESSNIAWWYPEGGQRKFASKILEQFDVPRKRTASRPQVYLSVIFTHPDYRRQGAGDMIMEWGVKKADELGFEMWLDSTSNGIPFYRKHGFAVVYENKFEPVYDGEEPDEEWKKLEKELTPLTLWLMWRPVNGKYEEGVTLKPGEV